MIFPYKFLDWHHRTIYLANKHHFIKCYLDEGRGENEISIIKYLEQKNFNKILKPISFFKYINYEILVFNFINLKQTKSTKILTKIDKSLRSIGVDHGDLNKNVFLNQNKYYVIDFAFSKLEGRYLSNKIKEKYINNKADNFEKDVLFIGTGSTLLTEIFVSSSLNNFHYIVINRSIWFRVLSNLLAKISSNMFTKFFIQKHKILKYKSKKIVFFDFPNAHKLCIDYFNDISESVDLYYWNPVYDEKRLHKEKLAFNKVWSFSMSDCEQYNLSYNGQFYKHKYSFFKSDGIIDIFYIGSVKKDRENIMENIVQKLEKMKINFKVILTGHTNSRILKKYLHKNIAYNKVVEYISKSKAILDISIEDKGISIRPLESLFYDIKLISTNKLIHSYELFDKSNSFDIEILSKKQSYRSILDKKTNTPIDYYNDLYSVNRFIMNFLR